MRRRPLRGCLDGRKNKREPTEEHSRWPELPVRDTDLASESALSPIAWHIQKPQPSQKNISADAVARSKTRTVAAYRNGTTIDRALGHASHSAVTRVGGSCCQVDPGCRSQSKRGAVFSGTATALVPAFRSKPTAFQAVSFQQPC